MQVTIDTREVQDAVVGDTVEISIGSELIRVHEIRHDRTAIGVHVQVAPLVRSFRGI